MPRSMEFVLASEASSTGLGELREIADAVAAQIGHDVGPLWGVAAEVMAFGCLEEGLAEHPGACPVLISDEFTFASQGFHQDYMHQPFALVKDGHDVSVGISHEVIEALVDPSGWRTVAGPSVMPGQGPVEYLVEVCDPPERVHYEVAGVRVSDFCTPRYYDAFAPPGATFSHTGAIDAPLQVLDGGYLSWRDAATGLWWQRRRFDGADRFEQVGDVDDALDNMRAQIDHATRVARQPPPPGPRVQPFGAPGRQSSGRALRVRTMAAQLQCEGPYPLPVNGAAPAS